MNVYCNVVFFLIYTFALIFYGFFSGYTAANRNRLDDCRKQHNVYECRVVYEPITESETK